MKRSPWLLTGIAIVTIAVGYSLVVAAKGPAAFSAPLYCPAGASSAPHSL